MAYTRSRYNASQPDGFPEGRGRDWLRAEFDRVQRGIPYTTVVDPRDFGVRGNGTSDDTSSFQKAVTAGADNGLPCIVPVGTFRLAELEVPENGVLLGRGGKIKFVLGNTASGIDCAAGARILGVRFNVGGTDSLGTSAAIDIEGTNVVIADCHFEGETGSGAANFKVNYVIRLSNTADCSGSAILNNRFKNVYYAIIRQAGDPGTSNRLKILGNDFDGINKGDAIELNVGNDTGIIVANNTIHDINRDSVSNGGIAIGIAGDDSLSGAEGDETRRVIVANNTVDDADRGIHFEGCNNFLISGNVVSRVNGATSEAAIQCYGCSELTIAGNHCFGNTIADISVAAESTDESMTVNITGNTCIDSPKGIIANIDGDDVVSNINGNTIVNVSAAGIQCLGTSDFYLSGNVTQGCVLAYSIDLSNASNRCHMAGNSDTNSTTKLTLSNATSAIFTASGNHNIVADIDEIRTIAADATTFDGRAGNYFETSANTGSTALTAITGRKGQFITIRGGSNTNSTTIADGGNFRLDGGITLIQHAAITLRNIDGATWVEQSRSVDGEIWATVAKAANYTATAADYTILCDATSGAFTITLPAAASHTGRVYVIKKTDASANTVTIDGNGTETIDGATTVALGLQYESRTVQCDGTNWYVL